MFCTEVGFFQAGVYCLHENPFMLVKSSQRQLPGCGHPPGNYSLKEAKARGLVGLPEASRCVSGLDDQSSPGPAS